MGKNARIAELEERVSSLERELCKQAEVWEFINRLCELPEDAVLLYTLSGQRISSEIGLVARAFKVRYESARPNS